MRFLMAAAAIVAGATAAAAAAPRPVIQAPWWARAGTALFHGDLSAQAVDAQGNAVLGSWTLVNDEGVVTMHGTWWGKKVGAGWRGTWRAKVDPAGGSFSGTWQGTPPPELHGKSFEDLLRATETMQISGLWRSKGDASGTWWLKPRPPLEATPR
ncbi:MAG TPA: hypothetical protein VKZ18_08900 [Polyangia bacterium]|nr:hypothetical protein [Polyangia bacterium]